MTRDFASFDRGQTYAMTSTPDGKKLFAAEGGSIAFIEADPDAPMAPGQTAQLNYEQPIKRRRIGARGVNPVRMIYDDTAQLLIIAGGRDGLWIMDANTSPTTSNPAWRVDDKGNQRNVLIQRSRKWCDDLATMTLGTAPNQVEYLVALFGKRDASHLCFYKMSSVRAIAALGPGNETGNEIQPDFFQILPVNPNNPSPAYNYAYGFGMDVETEVNPSTGQETGTVYVAMGQHGILQCKVELQGAYLTVDCAYGPCFGDNSQYAQQVDAQLYGDVKYFNGPNAPFDPGALQAQHAPYFMDVAVDRYSSHPRLYAAVDHLGVVSFDLEAPWSTFIHGGSAFHQEGIKTQVYQKWCSRLIQNGPGVYPRTFARNVDVVETQVAGQTSAALIVGTQSTLFTRNPADYGHGRSFDFLGRDHGGVPAYLTGFLEWGLPLWEASDDAFTVVYDLSGASSWISGTQNYSGFSRTGNQVHVPSNQLPDSLSYFACGKIKGDKAPGPFGTADYDLSRIDYLPRTPPAGVKSGDGWPPPATTTSVPFQDRITTRPSHVRTGRHLYRAFPGTPDGNLLAVGANDAGLPRSGPVVLDLRDASGPKLTEPYANEPSVYSRTGSFGITFDPAASVVRNGYEYRFCMGNSGSEGSRWRLSKHRLSDNIYDPSQATTFPNEEKRIFIEAPQDKFGSEGYYIYSGGHIVEFGLEPNVKTYVFANYQATDTGVIVLDMDKLILGMNLQSVNDGDVFVISSLPPSFPNALVGEFTTHPEFWNFGDLRSGTLGYEHFISPLTSVGTPPMPEHLDTWDNRGRMHGNVRTMYMKEFELKDSSDVVHRMLAVPSGTVYLDERLQSFGLPQANYPNPPGAAGWEPDPKFRSGAGLHHLMIRFFDVSDPLEIGTKQISMGSPPASPNLPAWTLLGPVLVEGNPMNDTTGLGAQGVTTGDYQIHGSMANDVEIAKVVDAQSVERTFCFTADLAGSVQVFEITDLLSVPLDLPPDSDMPPVYNSGQIHYGGVQVVTTPFASILAHDAIADGNPANVWSIVVDQVSFTDDSQTQRDEVYVYANVGRVGIEVYRFDVNATTPGSRLRRIDLIQTPGEGGYLDLWKGDPPIDDHWWDFIKGPRNGTTPEKLLFVGDTRAGFRIYGYEE